jgi:hypothetical protein
MVRGGILWKTLTLLELNGIATGIRRKSGTLTFLVPIPRFLQVSIFPECLSKEVQRPRPGQFVGNPIIFIQVMFRKAWLRKFIGIGWVRHIQALSCTYAWLDLPCGYVSLSLEAQ